MGLAGSNLPREVTQECPRRGIRGILEYVLVSNAITNTGDISSKTSDSRSQTNWRQTRVIGRVLVAQTLMVLGKSGNPIMEALNMGGQRQGGTRGPFKGLKLSLNG